MDPRSFKRDAAFVRKACHKGDDGSIIALKPTVIYLPERFLEKSLAEPGSHMRIYGLFAHCVGDRYAVYNGCCMVQVEPTTVTTIKLDQHAYLRLQFEVGARVLVASEVIQDRGLPYRIYEEILSTGHVPWYVNYDDKLKLLHTANRLANLNMLGSHAVLELNAAATSRDPKDIARYYRHTIQDYSDLEARPPTHIPLMSVTLSATNTNSRLMGSYFDQGMTSALAYPSTEVENVERLLRT
jgi:hypothetical protein